MLRKGAIALGLAVGVTAALAGPSRAAMLSDGLAPAGESPLVQQVQLPFPFPVGLFLFGGRDYCWYDDGWRGPGWYWCGYGYRNGYGWGGGEGFNGWSQHRYERDWHGGGRPGPGGGERHEFHGNGGGGRPGPGGGGHPQQNRGGGGGGGGHERKEH
jgi:hypothetical protein